MFLSKPKHGLHVEANGWQAPVGCKWLTRRYSGADAVPAVAGLRAPACVLTTRGRGICAPAERQALWSGPGSPHSPPVYGMLCCSFLHFLILIIHKVECVSVLLCLIRVLMLRLVDDMTFTVAVCNGGGSAFCFWTIKRHRHMWRSVKHQPHRSVAQRAQLKEAACRCVMRSW